MFLANMIICRLHGIIFSLYLCALYYFNSRHFITVNFVCCENNGCELSEWQDMQWGYMCSSREVEILQLPYMSHSHKLIIWACRHHHHISYVYMPNSFQNLQRSEKTTWKNLEMWWRKRIQEEKSSYLY